MAEWLSKADFVARLDKARFRHERLPIDDFDSFFLQSEQDGQFDDVDAHRLFVQAAHFEFDANFLGHIFRAPHLGRHGAAQHGDSGARPLSEPGTMQLMVLRRRSEVPQNRLVILRKQREAIRLVLRPGTDVGRGQVPDIVHVEAQERAHLGLLQKILGARQAFAAQAIEVNPIFPIHRHRSICGQSHRILLCQLTCQDRPQSARAASNTVCSVGTVTSSKGGENGIGTCIAPMRLTGASRS